MNNKIYNGKTGIAYTAGFEHKLLAEYAVNIGNICEFGCTFCYVPSITMKQKTVRDVMAQGFKIGEFSSYRNKENVLSTVADDLKKIPQEDKGTVFFCTTCDPCANLDHADISTQAIKLIMEGSNLNVRVLSKSILIKNIAESTEKWKNRIFFSLSTGTSIPEISRAIEKNASNITERVKTLHWLQDNGYRTYGMVCPVLPSEINRAPILLDQVRPEKCEHVWVEAINVRGKSLVNTYNALNDAGLTTHAEDLQRVMGNKSTWRHYSKELFLAFQKEMLNRGEISKLRYLQYVSKDDEEFYRNQEGAICL